MSETLTTYWSCPVCRDAFGSIEHLEGAYVPTPDGWKERHTVEPCGIGGFVFHRVAVCPECSKLSDEDALFKAKSDDCFNDWRFTDHTTKDVERFFESKRT